MKETYWDSHDLLVNVTDEIAEVKQAYGIPHLDHAPDCELASMREAVNGDLVKLKNGAIGVVIAVEENYEARAVVLAIALDSGRVVTKQMSAKERVA